MTKAGKPVPRRDRWTATTLAIACGVLLIGFAAVWAYLQYAERQQRASSYTSLERIAISRDGHSIAASFAVKTSDADKRWAAQNRGALQVALQQTLLAVEPARALAPNGLQALQQTLHQRINKALGTDKLQQIVITDFLVSEGDY